MNEFYSLSDGSTYAYTQQLRRIALAMATWKSMAGMCVEMGFGGLEVDRRHFVHMHRLLLPITTLDSRLCS